MSNEKRDPLVGIQYRIRGEFMGTEPDPDSAHGRRLRGLPLIGPSPRELRQERIQARWRLLGHKLNITKRIGDALTHGLIAEFDKMSPNNPND